MSASSLPIEILALILENFSPVSFLSLNSRFLLLCALVNRSWCAIAISILWRNPFDILYWPNRSRVRYEYLFNTYFKCFDQEGKKRILEKKDLDLTTLSSF